jgi:histidinol dehydrogenase
MKIYLYPSNAAEKRVAAIIDRGLSYTRKDYQAVVRMLDDVKKNGDNAVIQYTNRFDAPTLTAGQLEVTDREMKAARKMVDRAFLHALDRAASQIEAFHRHQVTNSWIQADRPGVLLGQLVNPVDAAGVYVPGAKGGETPLVSSVLMGGIPAKIAGVKTIVMVTPPTRNGSINPHLLVAAQKAGIHKIFKAGSAWAIAALAYGTETIPKVNVIVGPGNIYVTLAKKIVAGIVGIDMIAGPSEILVIADQSANPEYIAADLLSQAEHDPLASSILITDRKEIAQAVKAAVAKQLETLQRSEIAKKSIHNYGGIMIVPNLTIAIELANRFAPEHLELQVENPFDFVSRIRNAGAVFLGSHTPEPVGDYIAGPNHVLPTAGTAKFASALSVDHFIKKTSMIYYSEAAFQKEAKDIMLLAETEGLDAHARSVRVRLQK